MDGFINPGNSCSGVIVSKYITLWKDWGKLLYAQWLLLFLPGGDTGRINIGENRFFFHLCQYIAMSEEKIIGAYCLKNQAILELLAGLLSDDSIQNGQVLKSTFHTGNTKQTKYGFYVVAGFPRVMAVVDLARHGVNQLFCGRRNGPSVPFPV